MFEIPYDLQPDVKKLLSKGLFSSLFAAADQMSLPFNTYRAPELSEREARSAGQKQRSYFKSLGT